MVKSIWMLLLSSMLALASTAGCGRSGSSTGRSSSAAVKPNSTSAHALASGSAAPPSYGTKDTRPVIIAFGDSLTAGYGTDAGQSYPDYLQRELDARGYRYHVMNEGISGNTSKDGVLRLQQIVALHPAIVIVAFGGNDGLRGLPIMDSQMNLDTIISTLQDAHAKVILGGITLPPNYGRDYIEKFNRMYQQQARDYHAPLLPFMLKGAYGAPGCMQADGIHATAKGNQQVAKNFLPLLLPMLQKPQKPRVYVSPARP
jgi:acyl-CoA thioesterase-1